MWNRCRAEHSTNCLLSTAEKLGYLDSSWYMMRCQFEIIAFSMMYPTRYQNYIFRRICGLLVWVCFIVPFSLMSVLPPANSVTWQLWNNHNIKGSEQLFFLVLLSNCDYRGPHWGLLQLRWLFLASRSRGGRDGPGLEGLTGRGGGWAGSLWRTLRWLGWRRGSRAVTPCGKVCIN